MKLLVAAWVCEVVGLVMLLAALFVALSGCTGADAFQASTGETPMQFIERQCRENNLDCELVYAFPQTFDTNPLGAVEMCVRKDDLAIAEALLGPGDISPDPRFDTWKALGVQPVCWYQCPTAKGCNAYNGCFCPDTTPAVVRPDPTLWMPFEMPE